MAIATTLLNNDWYKFTMPPVVRKHFPGLQVRCGFTNRNTNFPLANYVDLAELRDELAALRDLRFAPSELDYLRSLGAIDPDYLDSLRNFRMPEVAVERAGDQLKVWVEGLWEDVMPAEVPVLQIITELVSRRLADEAELTPSDIRRVGYGHLDELVELMRRNPTKHLALFGARRHFSNAWEHEATAYLVDRLGEQIAGISNVEYAREFGYNLSGTIAHEYFIVPAMVAIAQGVDNPLGTAQNQAMDAWEHEYANVWDGRILCAIPDTFGTASFLRHFSRERAEKWQVFKQDSGDPKTEVEAIVSWLLAHDLDPAHYRINHTDGLNVATMADLFRYADNHRAEYQDGYGAGTVTSNNVGVPTHSLVWKPQAVLVDGVWVPCVKLSNNRAKIISSDPAWLARVESLADAHVTYDVPQSV